MGDIRLFLPYFVRGLVGTYGKRDRVRFDKSP